MHFRKFDIHKIVQILVSIYQEKFQFSRKASIEENQLGTKVEKKPCQ